LQFARERRADLGRPRERRDVFEQFRPLPAIGVDPFVERQRRIDRLVGVVLAPHQFGTGGGEQRLEVAEVSPQRSQGHPGPRGDLRPCGFELSRPDERDMSLYDGLPGALCASAPAVRRDRRLFAVPSFRVHRSPDFRSDSPPDRSLPSSATGITFLMANNSRHSGGIVIPPPKIVLFANFERSYSGLTVRAIPSRYVLLEFRYYRRRSSTISHHARVVR